MHPIGFSTGALAKSDFRLGLELQRRIGHVDAIELSALRDYELAPLVKGVGSLDLSGIRYISVHAPSRLERLSEQSAFDMLSALPKTWMIVAHPELLKTPELWRRLGRRLCIENMDNRKTGGRNVVELRRLFAVYPEASFCLDVGHARQIDPTMAVALRMIYEFSERLRQVHVSEVDTYGAHKQVGTLARWAYQLVARHIPTTCPLIIESVISQDLIVAELASVRKAFDSPPEEAVTAANGLPNCR